MLEILHHTSRFVAVDKPSGMLVHRTALASRETENCMSCLREQLGQWVYPVHRLDRATSGALLFALDPEAAGMLSSLVRAKQVRKSYLAVVRGWTEEQGYIDKPLKKNFEVKGAPEVEAATRYRRLATAELPYAVGKYSSARYSLVDVEPLTGRRHQIRRHLAALAHPVLGDTVRGDGRHNKFLREKFGLNRLLLHANRLRFHDPFEKNEVVIKSKLTHDFVDLIAPIFSDVISRSKLTYFLD